jgi:hypothetical protein
MSITTPQRMIGCYTDSALQERQGVNYHVIELHGNVDWHEDRDLGTFDTFEQAIEAAQKINCPVQPDKP